MLQIKNIRKEYKTGDLVQKALDGVSLNLRDNEFVAILGPSGSGKTTLLNIIGGLDRYDSGDLIINNISTKTYSDKDWDSYRNHTIGFIFQSYNLIAHQTILQNVELALTISGFSKKEATARSLEALDKVGLKAQAYKKPSQLSGGQMQRVAIARALVNDPDILLADEPTGALDSKTSIEVMDLLKEVAKDRLVVMVTHNPELALKYATRIVNLKDGHIIDDTNPYEVKEEKIIKNENLGKSSMSFMTALKLSFNNLKTKKARTLLTAFAGSIGIIGIALILSLSSGVNNYIKTIEEETLSEYPIEILSSGFNMNSMMPELPNKNSEIKEDKIYVSKMITTILTKVGSNDLKSLKVYLDNNEEINDYVNSIEYDYNVVPNLYLEKDDSYRKVNPDNSFSKLGIGSGISDNSMMSQMMSTDVFFALPKEESLYQNEYDIKAGRWPENKNEAVLVLSPSGKISDFMLYVLGLRDFKELDEMVDKFSKEENYDMPSDIYQSLDYEDILGIKYKIVNTSDLYAYDDEYKVYVDKSEDDKYLKDILDKSQELEIVGVVKLKEDAKANMLYTGINYQSELKDYLIDYASNSNIVKRQIENPDINVFTNQKFSEKESSFDLSKIFSVDERKILNSFSIDTSNIKVDLSGLDFSKVHLNLDVLKDIDFEKILNNLDIKLDQESIKVLSDTIISDFNNYLIENNYINDDEILNYLNEYLNSERAKNIINEALKVFIDTNKIDDSVFKVLEEELNNKINIILNDLKIQINDVINKTLSSQMNNVASQFMNAINIDLNSFKNAFSVNIDEKTLNEMIMASLSNADMTYESNLRKLSYVPKDKPSTIAIYPKDFTSKARVVEMLDEYNANVSISDKDKVITYNDYVGTLMSSVSDIIKVISYVLVAFVAISLVVSSIMIGVITYISVLERKKEIGILRAIGASKRNISNVFNAETFIIGLLAGIIGIVLSSLLLIPTNAIIHILSNNYDITANLPMGASIILIILSILLTLIGGIIPSSKAAKADVVEALRME